jgi:hypothetical protein
MLRKFFAVVLVTLAVSPFTAPFASCDLAVNALHQSSDGFSTGKLVDESPAIPALASRGVLDQRLELVHVRAAVFFSAIGEARPLVLRL